jgi:hypothetical protein
MRAALACEIGVVLRQAFFKGDPPAPTPLWPKGDLAGPKLSRLIL